MKTLINHNKSTKVSALNGTKFYIGWTDFSKTRGIKSFKNEIQLSYKIENGNFRELTIKENGTCNYYELEAFIAHFFRHYAVGSCSEDTLDCIAQIIYRLVSHYHDDKNIVEMIMDNIFGFGLPTHSAINRDADFMIPIKKHKSVINQITHRH